MHSRPAAAAKIQKYLTNKACAPPQESKLEKNGGYKSGLRARASTGDFHSHLRALMMLCRRHAHVRAHGRSGAAATWRQHHHHHHHHHQRVVPSARRQNQQHTQIQQTKTRLSAARNDSDDDFFDTTRSTLGTAQPYRPNDGGRRRQLRNPLAGSSFVQLFTWPFELTVRLLIGNLIIAFPPYRVLVASSVPQFYAPGETRTLVEYLDAMPAEQVDNLVALVANWQCWSRNIGLLGCMLSFASFLRDQPAQLSAVSWPGPRQVASSSLLVIAFAAVFVVFLTTVDLASMRLLKWAVAVRSAKTGIFFPAA